ncbi:MAG: hypothetical protein Q4E24_13015 [bacterium]|nr:hypothetical protein [bacterium]
MKQTYRAKKNKYGMKEEIIKRKNKKSSERIKKEQRNIAGGRGKHEN